jgi:hypothetical protein
MQKFSLGGGGLFTSDTLGGGFADFVFLLLDLFNNPVGYRTSLAKCSAFCCFLSGSCSETEVSEELYCISYFPFRYKENSIFP